MNLKKWKPIILKNPKLRQARITLRLILQLEVESKLKKLLHLNSLYEDKRIEKSLTPSQDKRNDYLRNLGIDLLDKKCHSILRCAEPDCVSREQSELASNYATLASDMVWNPTSKEWICLKCYNFYYVTEEKKQDLQKIQDRVEQEEKAFDEWFKKQVQF